MSGSTALAEKGELALMIGGEAAAIERAGPVLDVLSAKRFHLGGAGGSGHEARGQRSNRRPERGIAEGSCSPSGRDHREAAYDVFAGGALAAPYVLYKRDAFVRPEETPVAFTVSLMRKDLELALRLAEDVGVEMRATRAADEMLERACEVELEDADFASVAQVIREQ